MGQFESLDKDIARGNPLLRIGIVCYFLVAFIILMNVLIAFTNNAILTALYYAPMGWLSNRLRLITSTESMTIAARGHHGNADLFPQYIYYIVPPHRFEEFKERHQLTREDNQLPPVGKSESTIPPVQVP